MSEPFTLYDLETGEAILCASPRWAAEQVKTPRYGFEPAPPADEETAADDLTEITGIGAARARELNELGITTLDALAAADASELAEALGVSPEQVAGWQAQARPDGQD